MNREAPEPSPYSWPRRRPPSVKNIASAAACSALEAQAPVTITRELTMGSPPDDRARVLARDALAQIKRLDDIAKYAGLDATEAQELTISLAIRNYFIERLGS